MKTLQSSLIKVLLLCCLAMLPAQANPTAFEDVWRNYLAKRIPEMGQKNWILIADSTYPCHANPGIETYVTGADPILVLRTTLDLLNRTGQIRPTLYTTSELPFVAEQDAPGILSYRNALGNLVGELKIDTAPQEALIQRVDEVARTFKVLVIKTRLALPYSSVFIQLDNAFWTPEAEKRLRQAMGVR